MTACKQRQFKKNGFFCIFKHGLKEGSVLCMTNISALGWKLSKSLQLVFTDPERFY